MLTLIAENWPLFLIAFLIGIFTAWWVWARYAADADVGKPRFEEPAARKVAPPEPMAAAPLMSASAKKATPVKAKAPPKKKAAPAKKKAAVKPKAKAAPAKKAKPKAAAKPKAKAAPKKAPAKKAAPKPKRAAPKKAAKPKIPDNLELLKGIGPKLNNLLKSLGVTTFDQVANWSAADIRDVDSNLGAFAGRISRDNWVDQAKLLSKGDVKSFEKKYGSLGSEIERG
ncbi:MAG: hypothetical protein V3V15_06110 [Sphingorhabdus sp.]